MNISGGAAPLSDEELAVARAICKSRTCEGISCCEWPGNAGRRHDCPVSKGGYDDAARAAIATIAHLRQPVADDVIRWETNGGASTSGAIAGTGVSTGIMAGGIPACQPVGDEVIAGIQARHDLDQKNYERTAEECGFVLSKARGPQVHRDRATLLQALQSRPAPVVTPWEPIATIPDCDDLLWFCRGNTYEGPRVAHDDDADYWDWWCYAKPPTLPALLNRSAEV